MADRAFERLFTQAGVQLESQHEEIDPEVRQRKRQRAEEEQLREIKGGMTAGDAIKRILLADKDRDYFRMLELPPPDVDALGRPKWEVTPAEVSKAYRKLSVLVHPDKNPGDDARQAFEVLNRAHRILKDAGELESILKEHLDKAKARKEEQEARATIEERVIINARHVEEAKALRKQDAEALQADILRQMQEKQRKAKEKKEAGGSKYRRRVIADEEKEESVSEDRNAQVDKESGANGEGSESDDEAAQRRRQAMAKRRQQQLKKRPTL